MKIGVVSQYYAPEDARIPTQVARCLAARGHSLRVVTAFPSYPRGRVFDGYKQRFHHMEMDGSVRIHRVPSFVSHTQNPITRIGSYISFGLSSAMKWRELRSADVVYVYATQMTAAIGPFVWRMCGGPPYVLHVQDLWPESVTQSSLLPGGIVPKLVERLLAPFLHLAYRRAAGIIAIAPTMRDLLARRGARSQTLATIFNWADELDDRLIDEGATGERQAVDAGDHVSTSVVYAGNLGPLQSLDIAIEAAARLLELDGFTLTIFGSGVAEPALRDMVKKRGASNVKIMGRVDHNKMAQVYSESDFQLVTLKALPIFQGTIPSKVQNSLHAGVPLITNVPGDVASLVERHGLGVAAVPDDVDSLVHAFRIAHRMTASERRIAGQRCRDFYHSHMSLNRGISAIEGVLKTAVDKET